mmetsp:Transcript_2148/g.5290  ORF Transcript_2148/g.5290 Transcript_2148/m.5290 type:complete len:230 (+) Transcript_2148:31-720(+)
MGLLETEGRLNAVHGLAPRWLQARAHACLVQILDYPQKRLLLLCELAHLLVEVCLPALKVPSLNPQPFRLSHRLVPILSQPPDSVVGGVNLAVGLLTHLLELAAESLELDPAQRVRIPQILHLSLILHLLGGPYLGVVNRPSLDSLRPAVRQTTRLLRCPAKTLSCQRGLHFLELEPELIYGLGLPAHLSAPLLQPLVQKRALLRHRRSLAGLRTLQVQSGAQHRVLLL